MSCAAVTACMITGHQNLTGQKAFLGTLAETWNGQTASIEKTPNPPAGSSESDLAGVSCATVTACTAVGFASANAIAELVERWNGTAWTIESVPHPAGQADGQLRGVSCLSVASCIAVGGDTQGQCDQPGVTCPVLPLIERWDGVSWTIETVPLPPGAAGADLYAISCSASTACVAVGNYVDSPVCGAGGDCPRRPVAETWDGTSWTARTLPNPAGTAKTYLYGLSCPSTSDCVTVGQFVTGNASTAFAERWDGSRWTVERVPLPAGTSPSDLDSVACTTPDVCTAVGGFTLPGGPLGDTRALAVRLSP